MEENTTKVEGDTLTITRTFSAPRERAWKAWTDPEEIKKWYGPNGFTGWIERQDFRVGGKSIYGMHGPSGSKWDKDMYSAGVYKEIVPASKIVTSDYFSDKEGNKMSSKEHGLEEDFEGELTLTVTFEEAERGKTKLMLVHEGHPPKMAELAAQGWGQSLDKLEATLK